MRDPPEGFRLLHFAREALLRDVAPLLPAERQQQVALIARAMAIAAREAEAGAAPVAACHRALVSLYGPGDFDTLLWRLCADIRAGTYDVDGNRRDEVNRLLWAMTIAKLRESNPEYLAASGAAQASQNGSA